MTNEPIKVCTKCGAEYAAGAQVCADCGGPLEFSQARGDGGGAAEDTIAEPVLIREGTMAYLRELGQELATARIRAGVAFHNPGTGT